MGSYPKLFAGVDVSLIGKDAARLDELAQEGTLTRLTCLASDLTSPHDTVVKELKGEVVSQGKIGEEVSTKL